MTTYSFGDAPDLEAERRRLQAMTFFDSFTVDVLRRCIGILDGWRCAVVGAGNGSIARWIKNNTRAEYVLATDVDTQHMSEDSPFDVMEHDLTSSEPLPRGPFDFIHARAVLSHLSDPAEIVARLVDSVADDGLILIEEADWHSALHGYTNLPALTSTLRFMLDTLGEAGYDSELACRLPVMLKDAGLAEIRTETRAMSILGGTPGADLMFWTVLRLSDRITQRYPDAASDIRDALEGWGDPARTMLSPTQVSVMARRVPLRDASGTWA